MPDLGDALIGTAVLMVTAPVALVVMGAALALGLVVGTLVIGAVEALRYLLGVGPDTD